MPIAHWRAGIAVFIGCGSYLFAGSRSGIDRRSG